MHVSTHLKKNNTVFKSPFLFLKKYKLPVNFNMQDPQMLDQLAKNITRCGLSNSTLNYLRVRLFPLYQDE